MYTSDHMKAIAKSSVRHTRLDEETDAALIKATVGEHRTASNLLAIAVAAWLRQHGYLKTTQQEKRR